MGLREGVVMEEIRNLSKEELLNLIYQKLPDTLTDVHPCYCAACGNGRFQNYAYWYVCDRCSELLREDKP